MPFLDQSTIPWALAGFGSGGRIFHAPLIDSAAELELTAIVTADPDRRASALHEYPMATCVAHLGDLPDLGVRGVTISTPPSTHASLALEAIALGLHVVVDKPFALTAPEVQRVGVAAHMAGVLAVPYFNRRWDDDFRTVIDLVDAGELGLVHTVTSRLDRWRRPKPGWSSDPEQGGGILLDLGPHLIDQALHLLGRVDWVHADLAVLQDGASTFDDIFVQLTHRSGARSRLFASTASPATGPRFLVQGSRGGLRVDGFDGQEELLASGATPASRPSTWGVVTDGRRALISDTDGNSHSVPVGRGRWDRFYPAVGQAVAGEAPPPTTVEQAVAVAEVVDAAQLSHRRSAAVALPNFHSDNSD